MEKTIHKWAMIVDTTKCVGCYGCVIACQNQNDLEIKEYYNRIEEKHVGKFPIFSRKFVPVQCQHCEDPPCVRVCPVGASFKRKDGVVMVDARTCIGCKYCVLACPYNVRIINETHGYIHKCRFCIEFVERGQLPACVSTCPMGVRVFGDMNDNESEIRRIFTLKKPRQIGRSLNTNPSVYYIF